MIKKVFSFLIIIFIMSGCSSHDINDRAYNYFKNFDDKEYRVVYKNVSIDEKNAPIVTVATKNNKYYYSANGSNNQNIVIQKDNKKYTLMPETLTYNEENISKYEDYTYGMFQKGIFKNKNYETDQAHLFGEKLVYEQFDNNKNQIRYYFKGSKLKYIKISGERNLLLEIINLDKKIKDEWFNIPPHYSGITY